ncbi:serine/threonine-protein kinase atr-like [Liolophura sinensis]|uniref:serine/threonine-protein kinase atr-like n=1 Tax=Liolophura sinensis TaxID=3198878 RepID=UPI0031597F02
MSRQVLAISHRLGECAKNENTSVQEVRGLLSILVEKVLTNTDAVASTIARIGEASEYVPTLQLMSWYAGRNPAVFVHGQNVLSDDEHGDGVELSEEEKESHAFTCWCISRILRLLSHKGCASLHHKCRDTISQFLQVIKWRDLVAFHNILSELIHCAAELVEFSDQFERSKGQTRTVTSFHVPLHLLQQSVTDTSQASKQPEVSLSDVPHVLSSLESSELLQTNIMRILVGFVPDVCQFTSNRIPLFWSVLCCHLENGDYPLKSVSLLVMVRVIQIDGLPTGNLLQYFISCHLALLERLCMEREQGDPLDELDEMEECTARLCEQVVTEDSNTTSITRLSLMDLRLYYDKVALTLAEHGLHNLRCPDLTNAIGQFSCHLMERLTPPSLIGREGVRRSFISGLMKDLGTCSEIQGIVGPAVKCIQPEMPNKTDSNCGIVGPAVKCIQSEMANKPEEPKSSETTGSSQPMKEEERDGSRKGKKLSKSRAKKRKVSDVEERADVTENSKTFQSVYTKFRDAFSGMAERDIRLTDLETVSVFTEVCAHCILAQPTATAIRSVSPNTFWNFCTESDLCQIFCLWRLFLRQQVRSSDKVKLNRGLQKMARSVSGLLALHVHDSTTFRSEHFQSFCWILSLMWLPAESRWLDLNPEDSRQVADLATALSQRLDLQTLDECLHALSCFPRTVLLKWRARVLCLALSDSRMEVKTSALRHLPLYLCSLGTNIAYIITDFIHPLISQDSTTSPVLEKIAGQLGDVACVLSKHASVCLTSKPDITKPVSQCVTVICSVCRTNPNPGRQTLADQELLVFLLFLISVLYSPWFDTVKKLICC